MYLCGECTGLAALSDFENTEGLNKCVNFSSILYHSGSGRKVTRSEAIQLQIESELELIQLYLAEKRERWYVAVCRQTIERLEALERT